MFCNDLTKKLHEAIKHFDDDARISVERGIAIASKVKEALNSPASKTIVDLIPTDIDDNILSVVKSVIQTTIDDLTFTKECLDKSPDDRLKCYLEALAPLTQTFQNSQLFKIASKIAALLHGYLLPEHFYDLYVQTDFSQMKP